MANRNSFFQVSSTNLIVSILVIVLGLVGLYYIFQLVWWAASLIMPILFIATLIINYRVVLNYGKWILKMFNQNPIIGVVAALLTVLGFPIVTLFLFAQAMLLRKVGKMREDANNTEDAEWLDFEDVKTPKEETIVELPRYREPKETVIEVDEQDNTYNDLF